VQTGEAVNYKKCETKTQTHPAKECDVLTNATSLKNIQDKQQEKTTYDRHQKRSASILFNKQWDYEQSANSKIIDERTFFILKSEQQKQTK